MEDNETSNYIKICLLLKISTKAVKKKFDFEFNPEKLQETLRSTKNWKILTRLRNTHLNDKQWNLITKGNVSSDNFDLTLMMILLTNLTNLNISNQRPIPSDDSEAADLTRIKYNRNLIAHNAEAAICKSNFRIYWDDIEQAVLRLSHNTLRAECEKLKLQEFQTQAVGELLCAINAETRLTNIEEKLSHVTDEVEHMTSQLDSIANIAQEDIYGLTITPFEYLEGHIRRQADSDKCSGHKAPPLTSVVSEGIKYLEKTDLLLLTGKKGSGKTFNALEIIKHFCKNHQQFERLQLSNEEKSEIINHFPNNEFRSNRNKVVLLDHFLGRDNVLNVCDDIRLLETIIRKRGEVKIIVIVQEEIKQLCHDVFTTGKSSNLFSNFPEIDLTRHWNEMPEDAQSALIRDICGDIKDDSVKKIVKHYSMSEKETGLPLLCRLFKSVPYLQEVGETFFLNPSLTMAQMVELLRRKGSSGAKEDAIFYAAFIQILITDTLCVCHLLDNEIQNLENIITVVSGKSICLKEIDLKMIIEERNSSLICKASQNSVGYYCLDNHLIRNALVQSYLSLGLKNILPTLSINFIVKYLRPRKEPCQFENDGTCIDEDQFPSVCSRIIDAICADKLKNTKGVDSIKTLCSSVFLQKEEFLNTLIVQYLNTETERRRILDTEDVDLTYKYSVKFFLPAVLLQMMVHHGQNLGSVTILKAFLSAQLDSDNNDTILKACGQTIAFILAKECLMGNMESISSTIKLIRKHSIDCDCHISSFLQNACASRDENVIIWVLDNIDIKDSVEQMVRRVYASTSMIDDLKLLFEIVKKKQFNFYRITIMVCKVNHKDLAMYLFENFMTEIVRGYCALHGDIPEENAMKPLMSTILKATISCNCIDRDLVDWLLEEFKPNREYFDMHDMDWIKMNI